MPGPAVQHKPAHPRKPRRSSGWSDARRARHAAAIRSWAPWMKSTGPKTRAGKARSAQNAAKPHLKTNPDHVWKRALRGHARYLADLDLYIRLKKFAVKNELLKHQANNLRRRLRRNGQDVTNGLLQAFCYAKIVGDRHPLADWESTTRAESLYKSSLRQEG